MRLSFVLFLFGISALAAEITPKRDSGKIVGAGNSKPVIALTKPDGGWTVDQMIRVEGTVSDPSIDPVTVSINGEKYFLRTRSGKFARSFPAAPGKNHVIVQGTNLAGIGSAERTTYTKTRAMPIKIVLTSDSDGIYTDLHIYEPKETVKDPFALLAKDQLYHVNWSDTSSPTGGTFYLNSQNGDFDRPGYGPYLYTHASPQIGIYQIAANYWPSGDRGHTVAYLNITLFGGTANEVQRRVKIPLAKPGDTKLLAYLRIEKGGKGYVYAPSMDRLTKENALWPDWVRKELGVAKKGLTSSEASGDY